MAELFEGDFRTSSGIVDKTVSRTFLPRNPSVPRKVTHSTLVRRSLRPSSTWKMFNRFSFSLFFWCAIERHRVSYYAPFPRSSNFATQQWKSRRRTSAAVLKMFSLLPSPSSSLFFFFGFSFVSRIRVAKNLRWKLKIMFSKMIP